MMNIFYFLFGLGLSLIGFSFILKYIDDEIESQDDQFGKDLLRSAELFLKENEKNLCFIKIQTENQTYFSDHFKVTNENDICFLTAKQLAVKYIDWSYRRGFFEIKNDIIPSQLVTTIHLIEEILE